MNLTKQREEFVLRRNLSLTTPETMQAIHSRVGFWQFGCYIDNCNSSGLLLQVSLKGQPTPPYPSCSHWRAVAMGHRPPPKSPDFWELLTLESRKSTHVELGRISLALSQKYAILKNPHWPGPEVLSLSSSTSLLKKKTHGSMSAPKLNKTETFRKPHDG